MAAPQGPTGVSPVLEVPFRADGAVDLDSFDRLVRHTVATGVTSTMFPGYASEFLKLAEDERAALEQVLLARTRGTGCAAILAVHDHGTIVAARRAERLAAAGADMINLLPPYQLGPSADDVVAHLRTVLRAVAPLPVVVQLAPAQTGSSLTAAAVAALAAEQPNLVCVKAEAVPPGRLVAALRAAEPSVPAVVGYAGLQMVDAFERGAVGVQPGCSVTELYQAVWADLVGGRVEEARERHARLVPYLSYWMQGVELVVAAEKLISQRRGLVDTAVCRAPGHRLDDHEVAMVDRFLAGPGADLPEVVVR